MGSVLVSFDDFLGFLGTDWVLIFDFFLSITSSLFFFGGMSIHLSTAMLAHLFSYNMYAAVNCLSHFLCNFTDVDINFQGHGVQPERKSNVLRFGLKVRFG